MKTISDEQQKLNQELHQNRPDFGSGGGAGNETVINLVRRYHEIGLINSVLDYGTGKGTFPKNLKNSISKLKVGAYDPAVELFSQKPNSSFDLVTSFDVLEHVERHSISDVLNEMKILCNKVVYLQIDLQPAVKRLSSGRNAHILLAPPDWWLAQVGGIFPLQGSFPIFHATGSLQKIGIVAAPDPRFGHLVWSFLTKLQNNPMIINGGYLNGLSKNKSKKGQSLD